MIMDFVQIFKFGAAMPTALITVSVGLLLGVLVLPIGLCVVAKDIWDDIG